MDNSLSRHKPRRLKTSGIPSAIALSPGGDHLAVGCGNGDICIWRLPLDDDATPAHHVGINEWSGVDISSILWVSDTLVALGRRNGLLAVINLDYNQEDLSVVNLEADDDEPIRCISYHDRLKCVATATRNNISIWELGQPEWHQWIKARTFPAHTGPALSNEGESATEVTSVHWLKQHKGIKGALLISFLHHGVRIIDAASQQVVHHLPIRTHVGSLSLSADESVVVVNNTHNGFNLYSAPHGAVLEHLIEQNLCDMSSSVFMGSDRFLVYPGDNGVLKVWDVHSKASAGSVCDGQPSQILAVEARSRRGYDGHSVLVTLAEGHSSPKLKYITVWESLRKDELLAQQMLFEFSVVASLVVISAVAATWYLASGSPNTL